MTTHITANPFETGTDELERLALEECVKRQRFDRQVAVMVLPAGHCQMVSQFARIGAQVCAVDHPEKARQVGGRILATGLREEIQFAASRFPEVIDDFPDGPFDIIVVRRGLCELPYDQAKQAVRHLLQHLRIGGKLYLSVLGLHSELSEGYAASDQIINERFADLSPVLAEKYNIRQPVTLYTERNLFMLLLEAGASVLRTMTTTYGNVKGVAVRV